MDRKELVRQLNLYETHYKEEAEYIPGFLDLLSEPSCFLRSNLDRHITASAWIVNNDFTKTLLIHHAKLEKWLQPGGHTDGDEDVLRVALKEAGEETGIANFSRVYPSIFDLDIHLIPERKGTKAHYHYDIRFLFQAEESLSFAANHESTDISWIALENIKNVVGESRSIIRMVEKTNSLTFR